MDAMILEDTQYMFSYVVSAEGSRYIYSGILDSAFALVVQQSM